MKTMMSLVMSAIFGLMVSSVYAADAHDHGQASTAKPDKIQSLGSGKTCDKCKKNKSAGKSGMGACCCADMKEKMGMMSGDHAAGKNHDAMMERMQSMEARLGSMQKMLEQMNKTSAP